MWIGDDNNVLIFPPLFCYLDLIFFSSCFFRLLHEILSVLQTHETLILLMYPLRTREKKIRALIFNKDERKLLARKNGNENPIWSWNDSNIELLQELFCLYIQGDYLRGSIVCHANTLP